MRRNRNEANDRLVPAAEQVDEIRGLVVSKCAHMHIAHFRMVAGLLWTNFNDHGLEHLKIAHQVSEVDCVVKPPHDGIARGSPFDAAARPELDFTDGAMLNFYFMLPGTLRADIHRPTDCCINRPCMGNDCDMLRKVPSGDFVTEVSQRIGKISAGVAVGQLRPSLEIQVVVTKGAGGWKK
jgi:hypothetical protein